MTSKRSYLQTTGPFRADQLKSGDPYELSNGHPIECMPVGGRGSRANLVGAAVLDSDPDVESAGVDTGFALTPGTLRAPDVAVGNVPDAPGWVTGAAPPLAVEYADTGQDEAELAAKIADLLSGGTRLIWVVRLGGPRRVEVHSPGAPMRLAYPGEALEAPGVLRNAVPVAALFDREAAHEATLKNLLQRRGYRDLEQVRNDGRAEGQAEGKAEGAIMALRDALRLVLGDRGLTLAPDQDAAIEACGDGDRLRHWLRLAVSASSASAVIDGAGR
jgi:Uma2 family endonuclease